MDATNNKALPQEQLKKKITKLCGDCNAVADEIRSLAHTAKNPEAARILAERAEQLALGLLAPKVWGYLFHADDDVAH